MKGMTMKRTFVTALALCLGAASAAPAAALRLSLEDSLAAAAKASHAVKAARLEKEAAHDRISAAKAVMLPRLSLSSSFFPMRIRLPSTMLISKRLVFLI